MSGSGARLLEMLDEAADPRRLNRITCAADLIRHVRVDGQPMKPWPHVLKSMRFWRENRYTVELKSRQIGLTTALATEVLQELRQPHRSVCSVSYTKEAAWELIKRTRKQWESLPSDLRPAVKGGTKFRDDGAEFENGSEISCVATGDSAGAGKTYTLMCLDEMSVTKNLDRMWPSLMPAVQKGRVIGLGTARGAEGKFFELVSACQAGGAGANGTENLFKYMFVPWFEHPDRDPKTAQGQEWYRKEVELLGGLKNFRREHEGVFERVGDPYFGDDVADLLRAGCAGTSGEPKRMWPGDRLRMYKAPQKGVRYVIGADVALGRADGDFCAAHVIAVTGNKARVDATYHARVDPGEFADDLLKLARMYGNAWIGVESNNHGLATLQTLYRELKYRRLFCDSDETRSGFGKVRGKLGIETNQGTKPVMLTALERALRTGALSVTDAATVNELRQFQSLGDGAYGAPPGMHDDLVMALAIGWTAATRRIPGAA